MQLYKDSCITYNFNFSVKSPTKPFLILIVNRLSIIFNAMENKETTGSLNMDIINIHEYYEVEYWGRKFGISAEVLRKAVAKVGTSTDAVREFIQG